MSSNGETEERTLTPFVVWAQRKDMILLRVNLHPLEVIIITPTYWRKQKIVISYVLET